MKRHLFLFVGAVLVAACYHTPSNRQVQVDGAADAPGGDASLDAPSSDSREGGMDRPGESADGNGESADGNKDTSSVMVSGKQPQGNACGHDEDCQAGFCRDGVCCNEDCAGACKACAATYTSMPDGTCANAVAGSSPRSMCANEMATNACGRDGTCDGDGQCRTVPSGQACGQSTCADAHTFQPAATCDGAGICMTAAKMDCGMDPCATTGCAKPCMAASDCAAGQYCAGGTCKVKKALGVGCADPSECNSAFCSPEQVCCDKACTGACIACLKASTGQTDGTCGPVQLGQDPDNDCAMEDGSTCGKDGACDGKGGCHFYAAGMACGAGTCSGAMFTPGKTCNGTGMCAASGTAMDCGQNACTTGGCSTTCKADADCNGSSYCDKTSSKCTAKKTNGAICGAGGECTSGACVDGVCCNTACTGKCAACSSAKTGVANGTCSFVKSGTDPDSDCDASEASTCGQDGFCDGAGQCENWPNGTMCGAAACSGGNYLAARTCSQGKCGTAAQSSCNGAVCDTTSGCRTTCSGASDCTGNTYCDTGTKHCTALKPNGGSCGTDGKQCMSGLCVDGACCNSKCDGQCQSCSTGTCSSTKTPRSSCGGSGKCAGYCDGTSSSCRFPDTTTGCSDATCKDSKTAQLASTCNGSGTCSAAATQACSTGQVCSGAGKCDCASGTTSCPGVSGCFSTNGGDNAHCGAMCQSCVGTSKPVCSGGNCVQCVGNSDCSGEKTCSSQGTCTCGTKIDCGGTCTETNTPTHCGGCSGCTTALPMCVNAGGGWSCKQCSSAGGCKPGYSCNSSNMCACNNGNIVTNPMFTVSAEFGAVDQCLPGYPNFTYTLGFNYDSSMGGFGCGVSFWSDSNCRTGDIENKSNIVSYVDAPGSGSVAPATTTAAPPGTTNILIQCTSQNTAKIYGLSLIPACH